MILQDLCFSSFNYQSNRLEYLLCHTHLPDKAGWVLVDVLCEQYGYRKNILNVIVTLDDKKRFIFSDDKTAIRALYTCLFT